MHLASSLAATAAFPRPEKLTTFAEHLPKGWIERAQETGTELSQVKGAAKK